MATTVQTIYGTSAAITLSATGLVSDANLSSGRASTTVTSTGAADYLVSGIITASSTAATASKQAELWMFAQVSTGYYTGLSTGYTGTDANQSPNAKSIMKLLQIIPTGATTSMVYPWGPFSIAQANGGVVPSVWGLWIVHNMGGPLNGAAGTQLFQYQPITFTSS